VLLIYSFQFGPLFFRVAETGFPNLTFSFSRKRSGCPPVTLNFDL